jgi:FMN phosphatase YigB (HAD superfamily)
LSNFLSMEETSMPDVFQRTLEKTDHVILDLDDTLYPEKTYLYSGYRAIGLQIADRHRTDAHAIEQYLIETFEKEGRSNLFDKMLARFNIGQQEMPDILETLRNFRCKTKLNLFPEMYRLIKLLIAQEKHVHILTNGNVEQQKNKIAAIDWRDLEGAFDITYANEIAPKPADALVQYFFFTGFLPAERTLMIGDAETDEVFCSKSGIPFFHVDTVRAIFAY